MSPNPDQLAELRNTVRAYETEYIQIVSKMAVAEYEDGESHRSDVTHFTDKANKLIRTYMEYVAALERLVPC